MTAEASPANGTISSLSTEPVDHARGRSGGARRLSAGGIAEPERFLWCASPLEAVWAVLVVIGKTDGYNHAVLEDVERSKSGKAKVAAARAMVAERLGIAEDEVEGHFGQPFYRRRRATARSPSS